ncbi:hypothetical protein TNCV_1601351 [Trichonephila clavipes]|nr:hypothetical protein TNCV_1601351 [Trichonephila clavipes]
MLSKVLWSHLEVLQKHQLQAKNNYKFDMKEEWLNIAQKSHGPSCGIDTRRLEAVISARFSEVIYRKGQKLNFNQPFYQAKFRDELLNKNALSNHSWSIRSICMPSANGNLCSCGITRSFIAITTVIHAFVRSFLEAL